MNCIKVGKMKTLDNNQSEFINKLMSSHPNANRYELTRRIERTEPFILTDAGEILGYTDYTFAIYSGKCVIVNGMSVCRALTFCKSNYIHTRKKREKCYESSLQRREVHHPVKIEKGKRMFEAGKGLRTRKRVSTNLESSGGSITRIKRFDNSRLTCVYKTHKF